MAPNFDFLSDTPPFIRRNFYKPDNSITSNRLPSWNNNK